MNTTFLYCTFSTLKPAARETERAWEGRGRQRQVWERIFVPCAPRGDRRGGAGPGRDLARDVSDPLTQRGHRAQHLPYVKLVEDRRLSRGVQSKHDNLRAEEERGSDEGGERMTRVRAGGEGSEWGANVGGSAGD